MEFSRTAYALNRESSSDVVSQNKNTLTLKNETMYFSFTTKKNALGVDNLRSVRFIFRHKCEPFLYTHIIPLNRNTQNGLTVCVVAL